MKLGKRILSIVLIVLCIFNGFPNVYAKTDKITIKGDISNVITDIEYGSTNDTYQINDSFLEGIEYGDEVHLVADATYDSKVVGKTTLRLTNFRLEGKDAADYTISSIPEPVVKEINITKKIINISPSKTYIYYGQTKPGTMTEIKDYKNQIVDGDIVNITAEFGIESGNTVRSDYSIRINKFSCDNSNYSVQLDTSIKFEVREYDPAVTCMESEGAYNGVKTATLTAPEGYLISKENKTNSTWSSSININLEETQNGSATYYLRRNDESDIEYNQAISKGKKFNYTSIQTLPRIESITVGKNDVNSSLNFLNYGVFGNGDVTVTVKAVGTKNEQETMLFLGEDGAYESKIATSERTPDGLYHYTAQFTYEVPISKYLKAYASNSSGIGEKYAILSSVGDDKIITVDSKPVVLENNLPVCSQYAFSYDNTKVTCNLTLSDPDSGIAKVEYGWDLDINNTDIEQNKKVGNYTRWQGFKGNNFTTNYINTNYTNGELTNKKDFELELRYDDSIWVLENKHELFLRVTDNAGNVSLIRIKDEVGSDMLDPNITKVEIREADNLSATEAVINFLTFGIFYNDSVEIVVNANDNEDGSSSYKSGINFVKLNNRPMKKNEAGEYVLTVSPDDIIQGMTIYAVDNVNRSVTKTVTQISNIDGKIQSNDLYVEDDAPSIYLSTSSPGHTDNNGKQWFGSGEESDTISVKVADDKGTVKSGLNTIRITDNGKVIFEKKDFNSLVSEHIETFVIGELSSGVHEFSITAIDNAGNTYVEPAHTFYIDKAPPQVNNGLKITNSNGVEINSQKWFNKEDIISFRATSIDEDSGIKSIMMKINGTEFNFNKDEILSDETGYYVNVDTTKLTPDNTHTYNVSCTVTDFANNKAQFTPISAYVDYENPTINKYIIDNIQMGKVLNLLPFGTFSNDALILRVFASDMEFDSGINRVEMNYEGLKTPVIMVNEGNGVFSTVLPIGIEVFEKNITVTAYDNYGKQSVTCPNIESAKDGSSSSSNLVIIENIASDVNLILPAGDGVDNGDSRIWYKSNKPVELRVQDASSGIRNIDFTVNDIDVKSDKNGVDLLKRAVTEKANERHTEAYTYHFDLNYFTSIAKEPDDGKYELIIQITDNAGNVKLVEAIYYVDKKNPEITKIDFSPSTSDGIEGTAEFIQKLDYGYYFKTDFTATVYISDEVASSGLNEVAYRFVTYQNGKKSNETKGVQKIVNGKAKVTVPKGFKGQLYMEAFDNVLNSSGEKTTKAYVIDNSAPTISVNNNVTTAYKDADGNALYVVDNRITVEITDSGSGIKEVGYSQSGEQNSFTRKMVEINQNGYKVGDSLGDGWIVSDVDVNLVTKVRKTFVFSKDDNNVKLTFDTKDNCNNKKENVSSDKFTVDKTAPIINIAFHDSENIDLYYSNNRIADITVMDRNFDSKLIKVAIENTFGAVPSYSFTRKSATEYVAVINFDEGDYTFDVKGTDLGNHTATINYSGGNEKNFYVDKTKPELEDNFGTFANASTSNIFNIDKTVKIKVKEHNFKPDLQILRIMRKDSGMDHTANGFVDITSTVLRNIGWEDSGDTHTISFTLSEDAIYQLEIASSDLAGNTVDNRNTVVFEIDKTAPVIKFKNGLSTTEDDLKSIDVYSFDRKDDPVPSVEFDDLNVDHINYDLTVFIPDYASPEAAIVMKPVKAYHIQDKDKSGTIMGNIFELPDFTKDGVYELKLVAVDKAGNESPMCINTYARMVEQDVLAYVMDSNIERKTGLYSFMDENGDAISKRPDNFKDIKILVMAKEDTSVDVVLRDSEGNIINTHAQSTIDNSIYGMKSYNFTLKADYFQDNFQDDTDTQLQLTVMNEDKRIDLGKIHIDNIEPSCDIPADLRSWKWYCGEGNRTITISNISELIDESQAKVFDNGKEIPFQYSSDNNTLEFTLEKGWHNVGIILKDMAGNTLNIPEKTNIYIGFFWLWVIIASSITLIGMTITTVILVRRRKRIAREN